MPEGNLMKDEVASSQSDLEMLSVVIENFYKHLGKTSSIEKDSHYLISAFKEVDEFSTFVYFVDLSEENEDDTITYSFELFNQIASKF